MQRYKPCSRCLSGMMNSDTGSYVKYEDVQQLQQQNQEMLKMLKVSADALYEEGRSLAAREIDTLIAKIEKGE